MYLQYQVSEKGVDKKTSIVFYSILILYILSTAIIALDLASMTGEVYLSHNSAGTDNNLFIRVSDGLVSLHMDQYISADLGRQHSEFHWEYHGWLCRLYLSNYPSKHKPVIYSKPSRYSSVILFTQIFKDIPVLDCVES